jgi:hypothetical protein
MSGWIKIHRKFLEWQWFEKTEAVHLFIYLILKANHKDLQWQGITIKRGQLVASLNKISADTGISIQSIRTLLKKFENTNEISLKSTNRYSIVTICKYDSYQDENDQTNRQLTNKQQTINNQLTTNKNDKKEKNEKEVLLDEWISYRKQIKRPIKEPTIKQIYEKMKSYNFDQCKFVINNSIENGWQGLFWESINKKQNSDDISEADKLLNRLNFKL